MLPPPCNPFIGASVPVAHTEEVPDSIQSGFTPQPPSKGREKIQGTLGVLELMGKVTLDLLAHQ